MGHPLVKLYTSMSKLFLYFKKKIIDKMDHVFIENTEGCENHRISLFCSNYPSNSGFKLKSNLLQSGSDVSIYNIDISNSNTKIPRQR